MCPARDEQKAAKISRHSVLWPCATLPERTGRENPFYMLFRRDVVLPIDNHTKKRKKIEIMRRFKVALRLNRGDKDTSRIKII